MICPQCGNENDATFQHCVHCGASLAAPAPERRKLATLVFCDLSGSTAMGEHADAETVRGLMLAYFEEMRVALERHGGTVEKFVGDAVLAVFGVPEAHEDDALRACRAALEMKERAEILNEDLQRRFGTRIALRLGVNTGEVIAGDPSSRQTFVTGDAVNVAARLEQAAQGGEVLIGDQTYRLVRGAVRVEAVEPLSAKGKSEPVPAYRLLEVTAVGPAARRLGRSDLPAVADRLAALRWARGAHRDAVAGEVALTVRSDDAYAELAARAARKRAVLDSLAASEQPRIDDAELVEWYFGTLGQEVPAALDTWAAAFGWRRLPDFFRALRAEWRFRAVKAGAD